MDWQLVCEREHLFSLGNNVYYGGLLFGALIAGLLADRLGRLPVLAICLYAQGTMAVALNVVKVTFLYLFILCKRVQVLSPKYLYFYTFI